MDKTAKSEEKSGLTFRRYRDGDTTPLPWKEDVVQSGASGRCPTYLHRTPPCQGSCPSGHDVRGWLSIARGLDKPPVNEDGEDAMPWQEYAFRRMGEANPFPAIMGRVCPAPCQDGCNRNEVEEAVGINAVEQYTGDWALEHNMAFDKPEKDTGKSVAIVGGGPAGLAAAYFLRRMGHKSTIYESYHELGGMMRFGIPGYRTPRDVLDGEIQRILDMGGIEVKLSTRVGVDVSVDTLEQDHDAVFWAIGTQTGKPLPVPGAEAPNCVDGMSFLRAFNEDRLQHLTGRVLVVGAGDTAMDVAAVARRIGHIEHVSEKDRPESVILGQTVHDVAEAARRQGAEVWIVYRRPIDKAPATQHELESCIREGVEIHDQLAPVEVILNEEGRATSLKVCPVDLVDGELAPREGDEYEIECDLIVGATGQQGDFTGFEDLDNGWGLMEADKSYAATAREGHFVGGDIIKPHLLTTAIGHAAIASEGIDRYLSGDSATRRPKVDVHHFNLLEELKEHGLETAPYAGGEGKGTDSAEWAVHNYENRAANEIVTHEDLFLAHFDYQLMTRRAETEIGAEQVLGNFEERFTGLSEEETQAEADRCMTCGLCMECNNCIIYCPQDTVHKVNKDSHVAGRYVETDYTGCVGCEICADVCPSGYIQMGLGQA